MPRRSRAPAHVAHPLVDQLRFTRSEWLRGLKGQLTTKKLLVDLPLNGKPSGQSQGVRNTP
jgi:hypothetical protein